MSKQMRIYKLFQGHKRLQTIILIKRHFSALGQSLDFKTKPICFQLINIIVEISIYRKKDKKKIDNPVHTCSK